MPEYQRFIAYFYEYIDGKKQKNAGFAKVELRNGMWRILFKIRTERIPETPVHMFGFVRERGYLLGFLLGTMTAGYEISEEWAYSAEKRIGHGTYRFGDLSGIWIQSGDGRKFITVWDDDPIDVQRFVMKLQEEKGLQEKAYREIKSSTDQIEDGYVYNRNRRDEVSESMVEQIQDEEIENKSEQIQEDDLETEPEQIGKDDIETEPEQIEEDDIEAGSKRDQEEKDKKAEFWMEELFSKRKKMQPFTDRNLSDCIQIMPCDLFQLQQYGYQPGRSSFLQHGFYQYHHLLLGKNTDGDYILGVPGIQSAQEQYLAQLFGYDSFLQAKVYSCGKVFGYWCRKLEKQQKTL